MFRSMSMMTCILDSEQAPQISTRQPEPAFVTHTLFTTMLGQSTTRPGNASMGAGWTDIFQHGVSRFKLDLDYHLLALSLPVVF